MSYRHCEAPRSNLTIIALLNKIASFLAMTKNRRYRL